MASQDSNRKRVSLPISGLDTSTPDLTVPDGKCEELHNLRWEAGAWHSIDPLKVKAHLAPVPGLEDWFSTINFIYHHPTAGDNVYIVSYPNDDGTIKLAQVAVHDDGTCVPFGAVNQILVSARWINVGSLILYCDCRFPTASDVSINITYTDPENGAVSIDAIIKKGDTMAQGFPRTIPSSTYQVNGSPFPTNDGRYIYQLCDYMDMSYDGNCFAPSLPANIRINHFGNILIAIDDINRQMFNYYLRDNGYTRYANPLPPVLKQTVDRGSVDGAFHVQNGTYDGGITWFSKFPIYNAKTDTYFLSGRQGPDGEHWHGEICYFAAYMMKDGSYVSPSALHLCASELYNSSIAERGDRHHCYIQYRESTGFDPDWSIDGEFFIRIPENQGTGSPPSPRNPVPLYGGTLVLSIRPTVSISIPYSVDTNMIESVVLFSTRVNSLFDAEKMVAASSKKLNEVYQAYSVIGRYRNISDISEIVSDNDLPNQPFYKVKEINISEFKEGKFDVALTYELLREIEQNTQYYATQNIHQLYYAGCKEYNNRMHLYDIQTTPFSGYSEDMVREFSDEELGSKFFVSILTDNKKCIVKVDTPRAVSKLDKILSYPDYRAKTIQLFSREGEVMQASMREAITNNMAISYRYLDEFSEDKMVIPGSAGNNAYPGRDDIIVYAKYIKYPAFALSKATLKSIPTGLDQIIEPQRLQVSAPNNPFSFPLANSYAIGTDSNRIIAVNSAAIEMSDAKFGEFPLYVFTEEGIFTMQSGSGEVLYSATIPLNYDRILNPDTLAVSHNILYVTARGIQAMFSNESKLISEPLNDLRNIPPLNYLRTAKLCYQPAHNEVIVWNENGIIGNAEPGTRAYVYSLDGGYWSTRDFSGKKLNTAELVVRDASGPAMLLDIQEEKSRPGESVRVRLLSRPVKFGSAEFKRLETFITRIHASASQPVRIGVEGSNDLTTWTSLRDTGFFETDRDIVLRRTPTSMRYLRVTLEANIDIDFELAQFDAEYYTRYLHRLR